MKKFTFNDATPEMSQLVYGVWRLADDDNTATAHVREKIDICLSQDITTFDHADIYGDYACEELFGRALAEDKSLRDKMQLVSKCGIALVSDKHPQNRVKHYNTSREYIETQVNQSLEYLHTDNLDALLIHRPDPYMDAEETGKTLDNLVDSGKVKAIGVSNFTTHDWNLLQSHMHHKLVTNQLEISLLQQTSFTDGSLAQQQALGNTPMAWSPLSGGRLFGNDTDAQRVQPILQKIADEHEVGTDAVAIAWLLSHPAGIAPILGTNNLERMKRLSDANKVKIDRVTWFELLSAAAGHEVA